MNESYYRVIDGNKYDKRMLDLADEAVKGKGDGRISADDVKKIMPAVTDGHSYTDIEKATVAYIRRNYKFTKSGEESFNAEIAKLEPAKAEGYYRVIDGHKYDKRLLDAADDAVKGQGDGRISLADAKKLLPEVTDGGRYTDVEKATMEYVRDNYKWTKEADEWFRTELRKWAANK